MYNRNRKIKEQTGVISCTKQMFTLVNTGLSTVKKLSELQNSEISGHFSGHQNHVFMLK